MTTTYNDNIGYNEPDTPYNGVTLAIRDVLYVLRPPWFKWLIGPLKTDGMGAPVQISALTREYVRIPVSATENGAAIDPTGDTVSMAFTTTTPVSGDWKTAEWDTDDPSEYVAQCLVGPGGTVVLAAGGYNVWIKITDSPEVPVRNVGVLFVL